MRNDRGRMLRNILDEVGDNESEDNLKNVTVLIMLEAHPYKLNKFLVLQQGMEMVLQGCSDQLEVLS